MIKIYHNPRCRKSREGLEILKDSGKDFQIIDYLKDVPKVKQLKEVIVLLDIKPEQLIRKNEAIWKSEFKGKDLSDDELIAIMVENPKLIERPIVINGNIATIGRPPELIKAIL